MILNILSICYLEKKSFLRFASAYGVKIIIEVFYGTVCN